MLSEGIFAIDFYMELEALEEPAPFDGVWISLESCSFTFEDAPTVHVLGGSKDYDSFIRFEPGTATPHPDGLP